MHDGFLFKEMEKDEIKKQTSLKIIKPKTQLSKEQQAFNRLTKRIENLEKEIIDRTERYRRFSILYAKEVAPLRTEKAESCIKLAKALSEASKYTKFTRTKLEDIRETILSLLENSFREVEPDQEVKNLYDKWSPASYEEEETYQKEEIKDHIQEMIDSAFGVDIDMEDFDHTLKGIEKLREKLFAELEEKEKKRKSSKKTKKQLEYEKKEKLQNELKKKGIRDIYITLSKLLHPDTELDPAVKLQKEEIMKKVTTSYKNKDLLSLLKLEIEWVHKENEHLDKISSETMQMYSNILKEQIAKLEMQLRSLSLDPRFANIADLANCNDAVASYSISREGEQLRQAISKYKALASEFEKPVSKPKILKFVENYLKEYSEIKLQNIMSMFREQW
ncbi:MAG TPA: hypothetical protein DD381_03515 [Lentisphaeria bacterium]|nr:MAG: hypothetical protein A2X47_02735 [Lentisphaerae bacterium GWF2_38_69]HBM15401.1 hypothetical protein [Lentisphaeria bacterium]